MGRSNISGRADPWKPLTPAVKPAPAVSAVLFVKLVEAADNLTLVENQAPPADWAELPSKVLCVMLATYLWHRQ